MIVQQSQPGELVIDKTFSENMAMLEGQEVMKLISKPMHRTVNPLIKKIGFVGLWYSQVVGEVLNKKNMIDLLGPRPLAEEFLEITGGEEENIGEEG